MDNTDDTSDPVKLSIKKFGHHPSILNIRKNVEEVLSKFSFTEVSVTEMITEIKNLDAKKSGTFMNIPVKILKEAVEIVAQLWHMKWY